jgi:ribonuclease P protein component
MTRETFRKQERLYGRDEIQRLYRDGERFVMRPFRVQWIKGPEDQEVPARVLISVPKTLVPLATRRNLLKRRVREAYRRHKDILYDTLARTGLQIRFSLTWNTKEIRSYSEIKEKIIVILRRLSDDVEKTSG